MTSVAGLTGVVPGQGTDTHIMTAGTVSGTGNPLCVSSNGGATTSGCTGGGGANAATPVDDCIFHCASASLPVRYGRNERVLYVEHGPDRQRGGNRIDLHA